MQNIIDSEKNEAKHNFIFPNGTHFEVNAYRAGFGQIWYGIIEILDNKLQQSWGPYNNLDEAFAACDRLTAQAALPFEILK
jgi:hypothetical protein